MRVQLLASAILLSLALGGMAHAVDAVSVDVNGNTTFTGAVTATGQVTAPNVLQGEVGVSIQNQTTYTLAAFGSWHWISGASNTTIALPTAVGNAGKVFGLRVLDASVAPMIYTLSTTGSQKIDGATTIAMQANTTLVVMSDGTGWARVSGTPTSATPSGFISASASASVPAGWLECNGQAINRTTYAALFAAVGTTWGAGDGSTTFNVPNFSRRTLVGRGGTGTTMLGNALGAFGGEEVHTLTVAEIPPHTHTIGTAITVAAGSTGGNRFDYGTGAVSGSAGGGAAHNVMQPSSVVAYFIKY